MVYLFNVAPAAALAILAAVSSCPNKPAYATASPSPELATLVARQAPSNDSSICQSECATTLGTPQRCGTNATCICTDAYVDSYANCENCLVSFNNTQANRDVGQAGVDLIVNQCKQAGINVKSAKITGQRNGDILTAVRPELLGFATVAVGAMLMML
ncbi:hypothetical protein ONZ45_g11314 [Pleurotus djamor]|nr:hypothetical protein ONZ45_g11314 [Pleurotus djamor]